MKKVVFIITKLELGGAQKVCLELASGLKQINFTKDAGTESHCHEDDGFQTAIITAPGGLLDLQAKALGETVFIDSLSNEISPKGLIGNFIALWQIFKYLKAQVASDNEIIVHTHSSMAGFVGRLAGFLAGVKTIVHTVHGFPFNEQQNALKYWLFCTLESLAAKISTALVFVSQTDMSFAQKKMDIAQKKCHLIRACMQHWPIKAKVEKPVKQQQGLVRGPVIGSVACFKPQKNLLDLLKAFAKVSKSIPSVHLSIVGDGEQRPHIEKFITTNGLKNVTLLGWADDLGAFYQSIDIFALTSLWEGLPCAVVEALARKIPVVAYNAGGIAEVVKDGQNGFIVPCKRIDLFEQRLLSTLQNYNKEVFSFQNESFLLDFTPEIMVSKHLALYRKLQNEFVV